jgi:methyl-accepting chemotaxis protein
MKWFYNLKIALKLLIAFILVAVIAGIVGVIGIININKITDAYTALYEMHTIPLTQISKVEDSYQKSRVDMRNLLLDGDMNNRNKYINNVKEYIKVMKEELAKFTASLETVEGETLANDLKSSIEGYSTYIDGLIVMINDNKKDEAYNNFKTIGVEIAKTISDPIDGLTALKVNLAKVESDNNKATARASLIILITFIIGGMVIAIGLGIFIASIISKPIGKLVDAANKLAIGDVNVKVEITSKDEIGNLMQSFSMMIENIREQAFAVEKIAEGDLTIPVRIKSDADLLGKKLNEMLETNNEILSNINLSSGHVASGARQVSASSQALSQGATEQASSIEEITSSMTEVAAQTKQNAMNANQANELAMVARDNAIKGNEQMMEMLNSMAEINNSSSNISKIIKVIDEIAFQTNILALNAAVEAARAGQHGKGFAVVAEEVRNLAARSANAAKETTAMIEGSIKKVGSGTQIANDTAEALNKIVDRVAKVAEIVGNIASASNEQATGISQINQAIEQVAQVVQTNSATAEESAAASEELSGQAEILKETIAKFKLKKEKSMSLKGLGSVSPELINLIEDMLNKKKHPGIDTFNNGTRESNIISSKAKISLEDKEFGKY